MRTLTILSLCIGSVLPGHADSLWVAAGSPERAMFSDQKATRVGDILTVVILAGFVGKAIPPRAGGEPYVKER